MIIIAAMENAGMSMDITGGDADGLSGNSDAMDVNLASVGATPDDAGEVVGNLFSLGHFNDQIPQPGVGDHSGIIDV